MSVFLVKSSGVWLVFGEPRFGLVENHCLFGGSQKPL